MNKIRVAAVAALAVAGVAGVSVASAVTATPTTAPSGAYTALAPTRVLDTRSTAAVGSGKDVVLAFPSVPQGATAVALNVTETAATSGGYLTVTPDGAKSGVGTSNINFSKGQTIANAVTATLAADGKVDIWNQSPGTVQVVVDLTGYYATPAADTTFTLPAADANEQINTGGAAYATATLLGSITLNPGTYLINASFTASPDAVTGGSVFPQIMFTAGGPLAKGYATSVFNVGAGALEDPIASALPNDVINSSYSGDQLYTVTGTSPVTLDFYGGGYDSDTGAGTYTLNSATVTAIPQNVSAN